MAKVTVLHVEEKLNETKMVVQILEGTIGINDLLTINQNQIAIKSMFSKDNLVKSAKAGEKIELILATNEAQVLKKAVFETLTFSSDGKINNLIHIPNNNTSQKNQGDKKGFFQKLHDWIMG